MDSFIAKIIISAVLGMILGIERELRRKPLGLKTSTVIAVASTLLTIVSIESAYSFPSAGDVDIRMDPLRLAAQIVSGIGFLGAGVIIVQGGNTVTGLTTAALIWSSSGLGIAVGAGFWKEASLALTCLMIVVEIVPKIIKRFGPIELTEKKMILSITAKKGQSVKTIYQQIENKSVVIQKSKIKDINDEQKEMVFRISTFKKQNTSEIYNDIKQIEGISQIEVELI